MKSGYKHGGSTSTGKIGSYAKSNPKVLAEAKVTSEGPVLAPAAAKEPMALTGKKTKMRLDRPGRKMGGRVGADCAPLSSSAKTTGPSD